MSNNKLMLKQGVISKGGGSRRAILDFEAGIVYSYESPDRVLALFQQGKGWISVKVPSYSSGGWGRPGRGDADGGHLVENARALISAIGGRLFQLNVDTFMEDKELKALNKAIQRHNKMAKIQNKTAAALGRYGLEAEKIQEQRELKAEPVYSHYDDKKGGSVKGIDPIKTAKTYQEAVKTFINGKGKAVKADKYQIDKNLVSIQISGLQQPLTVAFRDNKGKVFLNSQVIPTTHFEQTFMGNQSLIQAELRTVASYSIPFNVLQAADLKLSETEVIEQGPESTHVLSNKTERHFTGALLLANKGRRFLLDIDRVEITYGIFNAFFVEVDSKVNSILEAYDSMKPTEVKAAEALGLEVKRQGEWFFIATDKTVKCLERDVKTWEPNKAEAPAAYLLRQAVSHGKGRPNNLFIPVGFGFNFETDKLVCGVVSHQGREHKDLDLGSKVIEQAEAPPKSTTSSSYYDRHNSNELKEFRLWKLVGNSTVSNFTISGDVD